MIEADRIILKGDTIRLFPSRRDKRFAAGGVDVLANMNIPDISVDPRTHAVTTSGGEGVAMFIDFQPASSQQLRDIRPQDIERIDIIRSPQDPRFRNARVAANYILKKYLYGGYSKADGSQMFAPDPITATTACIPNSPTGKCPTIFLRRLPISISVTNASAGTARNTRSPRVISKGSRQRRYLNRMNTTRFCSFVNILFLCPSVQSTTGIRGCCRINAEF